MKYKVNYIKNNKKYDFSFYANDDRKKDTLIRKYSEGAINFRIKPVLADVYKEDELSLNMVNTAKKITSEDYIYCLINFGVIVYIGTSCNVLARLGTHISSTKQFDSYNIIEKFPYGTNSNIILEKEKFYIQKYKPYYNKVHK
jgi:hypothetical protein